MKKENIKIAKEIHDYIVKHMESESIPRHLMGCIKQENKKEKL